MDRRFATAIILVIGVLFAAMILLRTGTQRADGLRLVWVCLAAITFNVLSLLSRWILIRNRRQLFLRGTFPRVFGLAKVCGLITCVALILTMLAGLIFGPPMREIALKALVLGLIGLAALSLFANGLLNSIIVYRHFRGTLAATSDDITQDA